MTPTPDLSIVVPAYNRGDLLERCLDTVRGSRGASWELTVVENASPEDLSRVREAFPEVRWLRVEQNIGYAAANNFGLEGRSGRHVCWLNSDAELEPDTLADLVGYLDAHPSVGAVTPLNVGADGEPQLTHSPQHGLAMAWLRDSGLHLVAPNAWPFRGWALPDFDFAREQEVQTSQTTCFVIRGEAYSEVGGMDPELFLFYNDVDYCRRLRQAKWSIRYLPNVRVLHHGSASVETAPWKERQLWRDRYRYFRKWYGTRGTVGVRAACWSRGAARVLAQLAKGRPGKIARVYRVSRDLCGALDKNPLD